MGRRWRRLRLACHRMMMVSLHVRRLRLWGLHQIGIPRDSSVTCKNTSTVVVGGRGRSGRRCVGRSGGSDTERGVNGVVGIALAFLTRCRTWLRKGKISHGC